MNQTNGVVNANQLNGNSQEPVSKAQTVPLIIGGRDVLGAQTFTVHNPAGGEVWEASGASVEDATRAVEAAQAAFPSWSKTKPARRRDIFLRAAEIFEKRSFRAGKDPKAGDRRRGLIY